MKNTLDDTTMICLFRDKSQADAAVNDLVAAGVPKNSIGVIGKSESAANPAEMKKWGVPERDERFLVDGINQGGVVLAVSVEEDHAGKIQAIFEKHDAGKVDETTADHAHATSHEPLTSKQDNGTIDVIEENLVVGKRQVQRGGVRVYQRMTEKPVTETISLRDETIHVDRHPVDRTATTADMEAFKDRSFEMTETDEEAVVSKTARVVEEVHVGKETTQRTEQIKDTVRKTDVTVEQMDPGTATPENSK